MTAGNGQFRRRLLICVLLALVLRLGNLSTMEPPHGDDVSYIRIAKALLAGEGFHDRDVYAYRYPAYVALLAGMFTLFGTSEAPTVALQACMGAATVLLFALIVRRRFGDTAAIFSAAALAVYVPFARLPGRMYTENLFFLLFVGIWWVVERPGERLGWRDAVVGGVLAGLAVLTREVFLPMALMYAVLRLAFSGSRRREWAPLAVFLVVTAAVVSPWTVRNYLVFHRIVPVATNDWTNIYIGNNPQADGSYPSGEMPSNAWRLPPGEARTSTFIEIAAADAQRGEVIRYWRENPGRTGRLILAKLGRFYTLPHTLEVAILSTQARIASWLWSCMYLVVLALAVYGVLRNAPRFRDNLWAYLQLIAPPLGCMLTYVIARYRFPSEFAMILFASNGYVVLVGALTRRGTVAPSEA